LHKTCYKPEHGMLYMRCWEYPYKYDWF